MITLTLDYRETLWYFQGGMCGSHVRWDVYRDMVNRVWPQCTEQERRVLHYLMRRDLGDHWRPTGWSGYQEPTTGDGEWLPTKDEYEKITDPEERVRRYSEFIHDLTPWRYFRQVLARFDPENQYEVAVALPSAEHYRELLRFAPEAAIVSLPNLSHFRRTDDWTSTTATATLRAYRFQREHDDEPQLYIDWDRRIAPDTIRRTQRIDIPDTGEW